MRPAQTNERGPQNACQTLVSGELWSRVKKTYGGDGLHTQDEGVLRQVPRVAQTVFLPQLAEQILHASHGPEIDGEVSLEKGVNASTQHKPHDGGEITVAERWPYPLDEYKRDGEDGNASSDEHADQLKCIPFVGEVARDLGLDGVVRVVLAREESEVAGGHGEGCGLQKGDERVEKDTTMLLRPSQETRDVNGFQW